MQNLSLEYPTMKKYLEILNQLGVWRVFEIWSSTVILPFWLYRKDFAATLKYFDVKDDEKYNKVDQEIICKCVGLTTRKPWLMRDRRCLRQALLAMKFLRKANLNPIIHFGVDIKTMSNPSLSAHCWVELNDLPVMNDILENMIVVHSFPTPSQL